MKRFVCPNSKILTNAEWQKWYSNRRILGSTPNWCFKKSCGLCLVKESQADRSCMQNPELIELPCSTCGERFMCFTERSLAERSL